MKHVITVICGVTFSTEPIDTWLVFASLSKPHVLSLTQLLWYHMSHSSQHMGVIRV